jgi:hypothetical protein
MLRLGGPVPQELRVQAPSTLSVYPCHIRERLSLGDRHKITPGCLRKPGSDWQSCRYFYAIMAPIRQSAILPNNRHPWLLR